MALITYTDKQAMGTQPSIPEVNKVTDSNMNEIKTAINISTSYSTTEQVVGTWIDGKPLYRKVVDFGQLPNATTKNVAHNINNLDFVVNAWAVAKRVDNNNITYFPINQARADSYENSIGLYLSQNNISIQTGIDRSNTYITYVVIEYTKTTD